MGGEAQAQPQPQPQAQQPAPADAAAGAPPQAGAPDRAQQPAGDPEPKAPEQPQPQEGPAGQPDGDQRDRREMRELKESVRRMEAALEALGGAGAQGGADAPQAPAGGAADGLREAEERHAEAAKAWAVERELMLAGCIDAQAAMAHVDLGSVELAEDGRTVASGLDAEALRESRPYLFGGSPKTVSTGAQAGGMPAAPVPASVAEGVAAALGRK